MNNPGHSRRNKHYHFGADAAPITVAPNTVTHSVTGLVRLALSPVKWGLNTVGNVVCWAGNTVNKVSSKL